MSFVEILQNCVIFNDSAWDSVYAKENRDTRLLKLEAGKPLLFGKNNEKGLRLNGLQSEVVDAASAASGEILVHQPEHPSSLYAQMLASLTYPEFPTPIGVIRSIQRPTYEAQVQAQVDAAREKKGEGTWKELLHGNSTWTVAAAG